MENNKNRAAYVVYNQRLAGYLMMHGFVLLGLAPRQNGKNLFIKVTMIDVPHYMSLNGRKHDAHGKSRNFRPKIIDFCR